MDDDTEPPAHIELDLDEALLLVVGPMANVETQLRLLERKIGWDQGDHDAR